MRVLWITLCVIVVDQLSKLTVLRTMTRYESIPILGDWLKLTFTENPGMAFGINFGPRGMVTVFSMIATVLIVIYLYQVRRGYRPYVVSLALILGGALGNIIDRVFYGYLLGYDGLFTGKVVDFIHVNLWRGYLPEAIPFIGGNYLALFPIWNVADMAIVIGVVGILFFQARFHEEYLAGASAADPTAAASTADAGAVREAPGEPPGEPLPPVREEPSAPPAASEEPLPYAPPAARDEPAVRDEPALRNEEMLEEKRKGS